MNDYYSKYETETTGASMFGGLIGGVAGGIFGGPFGAMLGASLGSSLLGGIAGGGAKKRAEQRAQRDLLKKQRQQESILIESIKADSKELYSSVQSALGQTSGTMGAVYGI